MRRVVCLLFAAIHLGCMASPGLQVARLQGSIRRDPSGKVVGVDLSRGTYLPTAGTTGNWHVMGDSLARRARVDDASLAVLRGYAELESLCLTGTDVTGSGLAEVAKPDALRKLNLSATKVTDDGLRHVGALPNLTDLDLSGTGISDAGLAQLVALEKLELLTIDNTAITDDGLATLLELKSLRKIYVRDTRIRAAAVEDAKTKRPELEIVVERPIGGVI